MEGLDRFLRLTYGYGDGSGYGDGDGDGAGYGDGSGYGYGYGYGDGSGYGDGDGDGDGSGYGYGYGDGDGYGYGYGYGDGDGDGLNTFNGDKVYMIDNLATCILSVKRFTARGYMIRHDLTTKACYIVRVGNSFAHGESIKQAQADAEAKNLQESPVEKRIDLFLDRFKNTETIPCKDLYDWHFTLTGSCSFGRDEFVSQKGIDLSKDELSIQEFIDLTKEAYGGDVIKQLEKTYKTTTL